MDYLVQAGKADSFLHSEIQKSTKHVTYLTSKIFHSNLPSRKSKHR